MAVLTSEAVVLRTWPVHEADLASEPGNRPTSEKGHAVLYGSAMRNVAKILKLRTHHQGLH